MSDLASLYIKVDSSGVVTADRDLNKLAGTSKRVETATQSMSSQFSKLRGVMVALAGSYVLLKMAQYIKDLAMLAARVDTLSVVLNVVGNNAGYTSQQLKKFIDETKKMGITTQAAKNSLILMASAQLDLTQASKLARVAQDAAVIGNVNSSEAMQRMIEGIKSGQVEVLKTLGINVSFEQSYAKMAITLGKNRDALTEREKVQARMNAALEYGVRIEGTYEASLGTAGKAMLSFSRYIEELKLKLGAVFQPALKIIIDSLTVSFKKMGDSVQGFIASGGMASLAGTFASAVSAMISTIGMLGKTIGKAIGIIVAFKDSLVALGIIIATFTLGMMITNFAAWGSAAIALTAAIKAATAGVIAFWAALGPVGWAVAAVSVAMGALYYTYKKLTAGTDEATQKMAEFQQKIDSMDMIHLESELDYAIAKLKNLGKESERTGFLASLFGTKGAGKYAAEDLKYQIISIKDQIAILATEEKKVEAGKALAKWTEESEAALVKAAETAAKAVEAAKKLREEYEQLKKSLGEDIRLAGLEGIRREFELNLIAYEKTIEAAKKFAPAEREAIQVLAERIKLEKDREANLQIIEEERAELEKITSAYNSLMGSIDPVIGREQAMAEGIKTITAQFAEGSPEWQKAIDILKQYYGAIDAKAAESLAEDQITAMRNMYEDLKDSSQKYLNFRLQALDKEKAAYEKQQIDQDLVNKWYLKKKKEIDQELAISGDNFYEGAKAQLEKMNENLMTWGEVGATIMEETSSNMQKTFSDVFMDAWDGDLKTAQDYFRAFAQSLAKMWADLMAQMIVDWLKKEVMIAATGQAGGGGGGGGGTSGWVKQAMNLGMSVLGGFGGFGGSGGALASGGGGAGGAVGGGINPAAAQSGGVRIAPLMHSGWAADDYAQTRNVLSSVFNNAPRYHDGIGPNEEAAIIRKDEGVFTPGQMKAMGGKSSKKDTQKTEIRFEIANIVSPELFDSYMATARGQNAIFNVISSKPGKIKRILQAG